MFLSLQEWTRKISKEDRENLLRAMLFGSTPQQFNQVMKELREKYDFIPKQSPARSA